MPNKTRDADAANGTNGVNGVAEDDSNTPNLNLKEPGENIQTYVLIPVIVCFDSSCICLGRIDLVATFPTKRTPIVNIQFTPRNLCLVAGSYLAPEQR